MIGQNINKKLNTVSNGVTNLVLWCQPNDTFLKIIDFGTIFETQKMSFGVHQSTTYENSHKMMTSQGMLWFQPNNTFVKIKDFVTIFESQKMSFGLHLSTTYENSHKMTTSEVMLWCWSNVKFMKNVNF